MQKLEYKHKSSTKAVYKQTENKTEEALVDIIYNLIIKYIIIINTIVLLYSSFINRL